MSIRAEMERLKLAKQDFVDLLTLRGETLPNNVRTEDMPPLITSYLRLEKPIAVNLETGWVNAGSTFNSTSTWTYQQPQGSMNDVYRLKNGHKYTSYVAVGGTRYRVMYCTTNPVGYTRNITGKTIAKKDNPPPGTTFATNETPSCVFTAPYDCYLIIQKDNTYNDAIKTYVLDLTYIDNPTTPTWEVWTDIDEENP